jgi:putative addiction module CopG family antidote
MSGIPVKLPAALERFVTDQVKQGTYASREAAIVAAVDRERRRAEQRTWLASKIQKGLDSGPAAELDMQDVIRRGKARLAARKRRRTNARR